jgi:hypothetical protein
MRISGDGVVYLQGSFERVSVSLGGFDLGEVVLDVDEVFVADEWQQELLVVLQEGVAEEGCGLQGACLLRRDVHPVFARYDVIL